MRGLQHAGDQREQRRLAAAGGSVQEDTLTMRDAEVVNVEDARAACEGERDGAQ